MEKTNKVYINSIKQISAQQPLVDDWFEHPAFHSEPYVRAIEPDYKQFFTPNESRRFGKILKRALLVSRQAMTESGVLQPDAIITGTGLGCIEYTEIFLGKLVSEGEELLNPTYFIQSTHNTMSSLIAIDSDCHAYNSTYAHKGISFECALQDAFLQLKSNKIQTALLGAHDEMTPSYFMIIKKTGYLGNPNQTFAGETAVAMILSAEKTEKTLCEIDFLDIRYKANKNKTEINSNLIPENLKSQIDYIMVGTNGVEKNDKVYLENCAKIFPNIPLLHYKHIFGEGYTASALGVYAAAVCLQHGEIPEHLRVSNSESQISGKNVNRILCYNHFEDKSHTFILLSRQS